MSESTIIDFINTNFWVGCIGALAPETLRLYNLRTNAVFKWNPSYFLCTLPLVLTGGFIASLSEPTVVWSAFYSGLCAPVLITTAVKDAAKIEKELTTTQTEIQELELAASQTLKQKEVLQTEIERLERNIKRLEDEKAERTLETTDFSTPDSAPIESMTYDSAPIESMMTSAPTPDSATPSAKIDLRQKQMLLICLMLSIAIVVGILTYLGVYPASLFIQIAFIVVFIIFLIYFLRKNRLFKEYLKGL